MFVSKLNTVHPSEDPVVLGGHCNSDLTTFPHFASYKYKNLIESIIYFTHDMFYRLKI